MDTLSIIITLVSVIAGVLQIILFFKIWGLCNDVRALRKGDENAQKEYDKKESEGRERGTSMLILALCLISVIIIFVISR